MYSKGRRFESGMSLKFAQSVFSYLDEGLRTIGCSTPEFTLVDYPTVDDRLSDEVLKSSGRLKQEVNNGQTSLFKF